MVYLFNMNYDQYKLSNPFDERMDSDLVTSCCGSEEETRLIEDEEVTICPQCDCAFPDMIEQYEYDEKMQEYYSELDNEDY